MAETRKKNGTGKKNSTAKKSNTVSNPNTSKKQMEQQIEEDNREVRLEVILLVILAFSIFLMIANFGKCGKVGDAISGFLFGVIGFAEYIFPVYLFISSAFVISNLGNKKVRNEVIYIGDSDVDYATARNAGVDCILVEWGFRDRAFLESLGATVFAKKPEDILKIVG